jgi:hypothetical protein
MRFPQDRVSQQFVSVLDARGEKNASAVLRAIVRQHIEPRRTQLKAAARQREADARRGERWQKKAAKQREYRARLKQDQLADAIELFLSEIGGHYKGRAVERLDRDAAALAELGLRTADQFAAVMDAKQRRDPRAVDQKRQFAEKFVLRLGYALAPRAQRAL